MPLLRTHTLTRKGTVCGVPLTVFSSRLLSSLGAAFVAASALAVYAVRCVGYSIVGDASSSSSSASVAAAVFALESAKPWCTTMVLIAGFSFVKSASTLRTAATVEGVFGALYFGVGRGLGGLFGGVAVDQVGAVAAFRRVQAFFCCC